MRFVIALCALILSAGVASAADTVDPSGPKVGLETWDAPK